AEGRFTLLHLPLSAGVGAVVRVERTFSEPVGSDDTRVYVFLSSDLATRTAAGASARRRTLPDRLVPPGDAVR
ncbi:MAG: hypothetical protein ACLFNX_10225, partial [Spirochaetaceae bacterium]